MTYDEFENINLGDVIVYNDIDDYVMFVFEKTIDVDEHSNEKIVRVHGLVSMITLNDNHNKKSDFYIVTEVWAAGRFRNDRWLNRAELLKR